MDPHRATEHQTDPFIAGLTSLQLPDSRPHGRGRHCPAVASAPQPWPSSQTAPRLPNVMEADILANAHFAAARFRLRLALGRSQPPSTLLQPGTILDIRLNLGGTPQPVSSRAKPTPSAATC